MKYGKYWFHLQKKNYCKFSSLRIFIIPCGVKKSSRGVAGVFGVSIGKLYLELFQNVEILNFFQENSKKILKKGQKFIKIHLNRS
jgi:hypothetical protein